MPDGVSSQGGSGTGPRSEALTERATVTSRQLEGHFQSAKNREKRFRTTKLSLLDREMEVKRRIAAQDLQDEKIPRRPMTAGSLAGTGGVPRQMSAGSSRTSITPAKTRPSSSPCMSRSDIKRRPGSEGTQVGTHRRPSTAEMRTGADRLAQSPIGPLSATRFGASTPAVGHPTPHPGTRSNNPHRSRQRMHSPASLSSLLAADDPPSPSCPSRKPPAEARKASVEAWGAAPAAVSVTTHAEGAAAVVSPSACAYSAASTAAHPQSRDRRASSFNRMASQDVDRPKNNAGGGDHVAIKSRTSTWSAPSEHSAPHVARSRAQTGSSEQPSEKAGRYKSRSAFGSSTVGEPPCEKSGLEWRDRSDCLGDDTDADAESRLLAVIGDTAGDASQRAQQHPPGSIEKLGKLMALLGPRYKTMSKEALWEKATSEQLLPCQKRFRAEAQKQAAELVRTEPPKDGAIRISPDLDNDGEIRRRWLLMRGTRPTAAIPADGVGHLTRSRAISCGA